MNNPVNALCRNLTLLALSGLLLFGCAKEPESLDFQYSIIQKPVTVKISASLKDYREIILRVCREEMERIGDLIDETDPKSELSMINRLGVGVTFPINAEMLRMIRFSTEFEERSEGQFTALIYPIGYMWGFHGNRNPVGMSPEIARASIDSLQTSTYRLTEKTIEMNSPFTRLDLGGLSEGYITDLTIIRLRVQNLSGIMVQVGDSARALGGQDDGTPYLYPVPHPFEEGKIIGHVQLKDRMAVSTSAIRKKQSKVDGKIVGHIINPLTAMPVTNTVQSIAIASSATKSDALATSLVVAGEANSARLLARFSQDSPVHGIIIPNRQPMEILISEGADAYFKINPAYASNIHLLPAINSEDQKDLMVNGLRRQQLIEKIRNEVLNNKDFAIAPVPTSVTVKTNANSEATAEAPVQP